jgi:GntR family transcriptional regulator
MFNDDQTKHIISIDRSSPLPLYYQLRQILLRQIQNGHIMPGDPVPSEKALQEVYGVSRITVRRALNDLASQGHVVRQMGRGTFVLAPKVHDSSGRLGGLFDDLAAQGFKVESRILKYERQAAPRQISQKLGVEEGQALLYIERLINADGEPISLSSGYLDVGEEVTFTREELTADSVFPLLERKYGIAFHRAHKTLEVYVPWKDEAELLGAKPNTPMLLAEVIVYDLQGQPGVFFRVLYRGDRYKYHCTLIR